MTVRAMEKIEEKKGDKGEIKIEVTKAQEGKRADIFLSENTGNTRSKIKRQIDGGKIKINGEPCKAGRILKEGDLIEVEPLIEEELIVEPVDIPLDIVYEDECLAVINKQQGLTVHAGNGTGRETLVNALLSKMKLSEAGGKIRPGIVHRIDKNTSGLIIVAKTDDAHLNLSRQIEKKSCQRKYYALLEGSLKDDGGVIETYIGRDKKDRTKMSVTSAGKTAVTEYRVIKRYEGYTLAEFSLKTGRTHQIRVHCKYLGHPIVGDPEYGYQKQRFKLNGQLLHAHSITFVHPMTNKEMTFEAELPEYFTKVLGSLKHKR